MIFTAERAVSPADGSVSRVVVDEELVLHLEATTWLASLRGRDLSSNTERAYAGRVALYLTYCSSRGLSWADPGFLELARFKHWLVEEPLAPRGARRAGDPRFRSEGAANAVLTVVFEFLRFGALHGWVPVEAVGVLSTPKHLTYLPPGYRVGESGQFRTVQGPGRSSPGPPHDPPPASGGPGHPTTSRGRPTDKDTMTADPTSPPPATADSRAPGRELDDLELDELLGRAARGDHGAFARLCTAMTDPVYGMALAVLADPAEAEKVTGQVLVEMWRTAPRYDPGHGTAAAWLMTLAHRHAVNRIRATRPARATGARHRRGLDGLTAIQRETVTLAYHHGHTYPQIAARLATTPTIVKTSIHQALSRLRDHPEPPAATSTATPEPGRRTGGCPPPPAGTPRPARCRRRRSRRCSPPSTWYARPRPGAK